MRLSADDLPEKERALFHLIQQLNTEDKKVLWQLIRRSNKDHICVISRITPAVSRLIQKELVTINRGYKERGKISLFVLRKTPFLMKKLQMMGQKD